MKRRIAVVASTFGVGGAEIVTANVLRRLSRDRHEIRLHFLREAGAVGRELLDAHIDGIERLCRRPRDVAGAWRLIQSFRAFRPDVMWSLDHVDAMWLGRSAALASGVPAAVIASHSTGLVGRNGTARPSFGRRERVLMEFATKIVAVTPTHARYLQTVTGVPRERLVVIENGIDLAQWPRVTASRRREAREALGLDATRPVATMIAAMRPEKAHEVLLAAVSILADAGRRVHVLLAGDGPRRAALEHTAEQRGIRGHVEFLGIRRDVARLLHASDVVVLPSRAVVETLPLSVLEAMACGVPVVASRVGSVPDVIEHGRTGLLVEPGDEAALARAIAATLDDGVGAARMVDEARGRVEARYSIERTTEGYERLFDEVMTA